MKIAILGSTSHIAKGLIFNFEKHKDVKLYLFARKEGENFYKYSDFEKFDYDVIINCVGFGDPAKLKNAGLDIFLTIEKFDNLVLNYLLKNPKALYINFSSGAVYYDFSVTNILETDYYKIAKINSEAKHRAMKDFNIVDIRVFAYFSRFLDLNSKFFIAELVKSILQKTKFITNSIDMIRDYSVPEDLFSLVVKCIEKNRMNDFLDLYSKKPCSKFELIEFCKKAYGLNDEIKDIENFAPTGNKSEYFSKNFKAKELGYEPKYTSIEGIKEELDLWKKNL